MPDDRGDLMDILDREFLKDRYDLEHADESQTVVGSVALLAALPAEAVMGTRLRCATRS